MMNAEQATHFLAEKLPPDFDFCVYESGHRAPDGFSISRRLTVLRKNGTVDADEDFRVNSADFEPAARAALDHAQNHLIREAEKDASAPVINGDIPF